MNFQSVVPAMLAGILSLGCATGHRMHQAPAAGAQIHTFRRAYTNAHLVVRGDDYFLFDAGEEGEAPALAADLEAAGFNPTRLRAIVLSHGHADHAGGASWFARTYGTPVVVGAGDASLLAEGHNDTLCPTDATGRRRLDHYQSATYTPIVGAIEVTDTTDLADLTGIPGRIVALSGHTAGSLVVILDDTALVGDLFRGGLLGHGAAVHFYMCDLPGNRRDILALLDTLAPNATTFYPGHFGPNPRAAVERRFR